MRQLKPLVKTYDWGMPVDQSMASLFITNDEKHHDKIAELWWGHPSVMINDESMDTMEIPFLLKLLFVEKPLSLQLHPTMDHLHRYPSSFPDSLPKPEVIIALTDFKALCGFLSSDQVHQNISCIPLLCSFSDFNSLFNNNHTVDLDTLLESVREYAVQYPNHPHCRSFLSLLQLYPSGDPAVLCPFYMHHVFLKKGQALVIPASQPHCYLSGQGIECMPPSDNVIRCGLTRKDCHRELFFEMSRDSPQEIFVKNYPYDYPELDPYFRLYLPICYFFCRKGSVLLVLDGEGIIDGKETKQGDSWIVEEDKTIRFPDEMDVVIAVPQF